MIDEREEGKQERQKTERAGEKNRGVGGRRVGDGGGLLPSSHARLGCYDNIICGQAELLKSEGLRCALGWP